MAVNCKLFLGPYFLVRKLKVGNRTMGKCRAMLKGVVGEDGVRYQHSKTAEAQPNSSRAAEAQEKETEKDQRPEQDDVYKNYREYEKAREEKGRQALALNTRESSIHPIVIEEKVKMLKASANVPDDSQHTALSKHYELNPLLAASKQIQTSERKKWQVAPSFSYLACHQQKFSSDQTDIASQKDSSLMATSPVSQNSSTDKHLSSSEPSSGNNVQKFVKNSEKTELNKRSSPLTSSAENVQHLCNSSEQTESNKRMSRPTPSGNNVKHLLKNIEQTDRNRSSSPVSSKGKKVSHSINQSAHGGLNKMSPAAPPNFKTEPNSIKHSEESLQFKKKFGEILSQSAEVGLKSNTAGLPNTKVTNEINKRRHYGTPGPSSQMLAAVLANNKQVEENEKKFISTLSNSKKSSTLHTSNSSSTLHHTKSKELSSRDIEVIRTFPSEDLGTKNESEQESTNANKKQQRTPSRPPHTAFPRSTGKPMPTPAPAKNTNEVTQSHENDSFKFIAALVGGQDPSVMSSKTPKQHTRNSKPKFAPVHEKHAGLDNSCWKSIKPVKQRQKNFNPSLEGLRSELMPMKKKSELKEVPPIVPVIPQTLPVVTESGIKIDKFELQANYYYHPKYPRMRRYR